MSKFMSSIGFTGLRTDDVSLYDLDTDEGIRPIELQNQEDTAYRYFLDIMTIRSNFIAHHYNERRMNHD